MSFLNKLFGCFGKRESTLAEEKKEAVEAKKDYDADEAAAEAAETVPIGHEPAGSPLNPAGDTRPSDLPSDDHAVGAHA